MNIQEMSDKQLLIAKHYYHGARHKANELVQSSNGRENVFKAFELFNLICKSESILTKERFRRIREQ
jgi:hypothetical protein